MLTKRVLRCLAVAGLVAAMFAPSGAHALYDCVVVSGTPASACARDRLARSVFMRFVRGPLTVIVEGESRSGEQAGTFVCVKVFVTRTFSMNCSQSLRFTIDDALGTAKIAGSFPHPKYGSITLDITSTATAAAPRLHKDQMRQSAGAFCDVGFTQITAPRLARDAGAVGYVAFKKVLGRVAATSASPAPASHRLWYMASVSVGFGTAACTGTSTPDMTLYRLLTCSEPVCAGLERGVRVVATGPRSRISLMSWRETGTKQLHQPQPSGPSMQEPGYDCIATAHKGRGRWFEPRYVWCAPGLLNAQIDPVLRTATMKSTVATPDLGQVRIDLSFAGPNDPAVRYRPESFLTVYCLRAYGHTETVLREAQAAVTGTVQGSRFPSVRFSGGAPLQGLMWTKAYATQWMSTRDIPAEC